MARKITVSSRALGKRTTVTVLVYDDLATMRQAAERYNGSDHARSLGVTQVRVDDHDRAVTVLVRLAREYLGTQVVSHEMHHAATALYGASIGLRPMARAHLNHCNEPFAHLYSDLLAGLVRRLYALGYYAEP